MAARLINHRVEPDDYRAVRREGAGLIDLSARGRIMVSGSEAAMFLNGLLTNDVKALTAESWMPAIFPNVHGRLLAYVRVIRRDDDFLIETESVTRETVLKLLERFTLAGDFRVTDVTEDTALLSVQGRKAIEIVGSLSGGTLEVGRGQVARAKIGNDVDVTLIRATHTSEDGLDLFTDAANADHIRDALTTAGAELVSESTLESLRIEAGIPRFGIDMDESTVVTETNLDEAVSFTKGCYIGQEVIIRIKHRGHVAKRLAGLILEDSTGFEPGVRIFSAENTDVGRVTSATFSPQLGRSIALGYVKYGYLGPGTHVKINLSEKEVSALVSELPIVRGSWYEDLPAN